MFGLDQHFGDVAINLLHGIDVHAVSRHLGCFLVLVENRAEPLPITLRLRNDARFVALRLFFQAGSSTNGPGNHIIGIRLGFVFGPLALLTGLEHIIKGSLNLLGRAHAPLLQIDAHHLNAHFVAVQDDLHDRPDTRANLIALFRQC